MFEREELAGLSPETVYVLWQEGLVYDADMYAICFDQSDDDDDFDGYWDSL